MSKGTIKARLHVSSENKSVLGDDRLGRAHWRGIGGGAAEV